MGESEFRGFHQSSIEKHHIFHHSRERYFSEVYCFPERFFSLATRYSSDTCEIDPGLRYLDTTSNIEIGIVVLELHIRELAHHRDEEIELTLRESASRSLGISELGMRRECLDLDENRTIALDGKCQSRAREDCPIRVDELHARIRQVDESLLLHTEQSHTIRRAETILQSSQYPIVLSTHSLEK